MQPADCADCETLFRLIFDPLAPREDCDECLLTEHFQAHIERFPEGQFVAIDNQNGTLVGASTTLRKTFDLAHPHLDKWWHSIGEGWLTTHQPQGDWLYGVESFVQADYRGRGIGRDLMNARKALARRLNLRGIFAGSMPIGFHQTPESTPIEAYLKAVVAGERWDDNLSKQLRMGFRPYHAIPNYVTDREPRGYGVVIVWENPDFVG